MTLLHLAYLQQISDLLEDKHKPLAARYGYIAKKISSKHVIHSEGKDPPKLRHCKTCQAPITCDNIKTKNKRIVVRCSICSFKREYSATIKSNDKKSVEKFNERKEETIKQQQTT